MKRVEVTSELVSRLAELAKLELRDDEILEYKSNLQKILNYIEKIKQFEDAPSEKEAEEGQIKFILDTDSFSYNRKSSSQIKSGDHSSEVGTSFKVPRMI